MWEIGIGDQVQTFLYAVLLGVLLCLFYDLLRTGRKVCKLENIAVFAGDILFWLFATLLTFLFLLSRTNGELRGYVFAAEFIGFFVCRISLSRFFLKITVKILSLLCRFVGLIEQTFNRFCAVSIKNMKITANNLKKLLKKVLCLLYTKLNIRNKKDKGSVEL